MRRLCTASLLTISLSSCASPATPAGESTAAKPTGEAKAKPKLDAKSSDTKAADAEMTPTPTPAVEVTPEVERAIAEGIDAFAIDLHRELGKQPGNVFVSPASIAIAFAMVHAGARGQTAEEIARNFHFGETAKLHEGFAATLGRWDAAAGGLELDVANRLYGERTVAFEQPFLDATATSFGAGLEKVDFVSAGADARTRINGWVAERTHDKIVDLLPASAVTSATRLVLVNAAYFKAQWAEPFEVMDSADAPFHGTRGDERVKMMSRIDHYRLGEAKDAGARVLELPYSGGEYSMVIVLPDDAKSLATLEQALTADRLKGWIDAATPTRVELKLPRFRIEPKSSMSLRGTLEKLGVVTAFDADKADLTGMAPKSEQLFVSDAFHKAFIAVDEAGTEAAAATAVAAKAGAAMPTDAPVPFVADHPFLFLVRDTKTGAILFMGRLVDPTS